jgi:GNAT superfamily N-acetyltransferase
MEFIQKTNEENEAVSAIIKRLGSGILDILVSRGKTYRAEDLDGILVYEEKKIIGLGLYYIKNYECEIVFMETFVQNKGIGTHLIELIKEIAKKEKCKRMWLITTNENINAIKFYQKRGFYFANVHINSIEESRKINPEIPLEENGIKIRDEIEFEIKL